jgi:anti-sigma factor RsiW
MHISQEQLNLLVQDKLPPDELLQIQDHLIECEACAKTLADFLAAAGQPFEQRRHPRSACDIAAHIYVLSPAYMSTEGRVVQTSEAGLRVRLPKALLVGSLVQIRTTHAIYIGEVRHCQNTIAGFEAGVRVIVTTRISPTTP